MSTRGRCENCLHWVSSLRRRFDRRDEAGRIERFFLSQLDTNKIHGSCMRYTPEAGLFGGWPTTLAENGCGEFEPKPTPNDSEQNTA